MRKSKRKNKIEKKKIFYANERIRTPEVFVIDENGTQLGVMPTSKALAMAREKELDLVEVSPQANPPVAKIIDYGQFKYQQNKQDHKQKVKQRAAKTKEIKLSVRIGQHDFDTRIKQGIKFLEQGDKIKILVLLKGREMQHKNLAHETLKRFKDAINNTVSVATEQDIAQQGRNFSLILTKSN